MFCNFDHFRFSYLCLCAFLRRSACDHKTSRLMRPTLATSRRPDGLWQNAVIRMNQALLDNINRKVELLVEDVKFLTQITQRNSIVETLENIQHINFPISTKEEMKSWETMMNSLKMLVLHYSV